jgi:hypothetical protein
MYKFGQTYPYHYFPLSPPKSSILLPHRIRTSTLPHSSVLHQPNKNKEIITRENEDYLQNSSLVYTGTNRASSADQSGWKIVELRIPKSRSFDGLKDPKSSSTKTAVTTGNPHLRRSRPPLPHCFSRPRESLGLGSTTTISQLGIQLWNFSHDLTRNLLLSAPAC